MNPITQQLIVNEAMSWLNTPYHHEGDIKGAGVDCAMLLVKVYHDVGLIPEIDPRPYPRDWHMHRDDERYLDWVKQYADSVEHPQPGDLALFQFGRCVAHGAIIIEWPLVIHAFALNKIVVMSDIEKNEDFLKRFRRFFRVREY
jgi:cell wall-associated NlpC family hydrolase